MTSVPLPSIKFNSSSLFDILQLYLLHPVGLSSLHALITPGNAFLELHSQPTWRYTFIHTCILIDIIPESFSCRWIDENCVYPLMLLLLLLLCVVGTPLWRVLLIHPFQCKFNRFIPRPPSEILLALPPSKTSLLLFVCSRMYKVLLQVRDDEEKVTSSSWFR